MTHEDRKKINKLTSIRDISDGFIDVSKNYYSTRINSNVIIDERLKSFCLHFR